MKLVLFFSILEFVFCIPFINDKIETRIFCSECVISLCDKFKECRKIIDFAFRTIKAEYNDKRDVLEPHEWTKNQVGIYYKDNQKFKTPPTELPIPNCLGTLVKPTIVLTDINCLIDDSAS